MKKTSLIFLFLTISACAGLSAQTFSLITGREPAVSLNGPWRFHTGDNPAWASPGFDDSGWDRMDLNPVPGAVAAYKGTPLFVPGWTARGYAGYSGFAWYRLRINLRDLATGPIPEANSTLALLMPQSFDDAYQVFVNGRFIGEFGHFAAHHVTPYFSRAQAFPLPEGATARPGGAMVIAIRMWMDPSTSLTYPDAGGLHEPPVIGQASTVDDMLLLDWDALDRVVASNILEISILMLALLVAFGLYWLDREDPANLWLGLIWSANLVFSTLVIIGYYTTWIGGKLLLAVQGEILSPAIIGLWVIFWAYWFRLEKISQLHRRVWTVFLLLATGTAMLRWPFYGRLVPVHADVWLLPFTLFCKLLLGVLLIWVTGRGIRKDRTEGWLALPAVVLVVISVYEPELLIAHVPTQFYPFRCAVGLDQIANMLSLGIITLLLLRRFLKGQRQREQWRMEIEQARQVQALLIPAQAPDTPGFAVDSVYFPASEVGGDFFHVRPENDGSLLIVVGDVSGKGLKAAMTVSAIIGALRNDKSREPAQVLGHLNGVLCGQIGGFVTCTATLITEDGAMIIANAGHLPPYRNGEELSVPSGLPLGIVTEAAYEETIFELAPNARLTFISDGVVEATNARRELYGFERTRAISNQPAAAIADSAQRWGQEDDITVLTVMRAGKLEAAIA